MLVTSTPTELAATSGPRSPSGFSGTRALHGRDLETLESLKPDLGLHDKARLTYLLGACAQFGIGLNVHALNALHDRDLEPAKRLNKVLLETIPPNQQNQLIWQGMSRHGDTLVFNRVAALVENFGNIRILEVASGTTFPLGDQNYGSPWLARALKAEFGDRVQIICTDSKTVTENDSPLIIARAPDALLGLDTSINPRHLNETGQKQLSQALEKRQIITGTSSLGKTLAAYSNRPLPAEADFFVRLPQDPGFEKDVFGIDYRMGVSLEQPDAVAKEGPFHLIFGRHLERSRSWNFDALTALLSEQAEIIIHVDHIVETKRRFHAQRMHGTMKHLI